MYLKPSGKPLVPVMDNHTLPVGQSGGESGGQDWEEGLQEGPELLHCYFLLGLGAVPGRGLPKADRDAQLLGPPD